MATQDGDSRRGGSPGRSRRADDSRAVAESGLGGPDESRPTSSSTATTGTRSPGTRRRPPSRSSPTACSRWGSTKGDAFGIVGRHHAGVDAFDFALGSIGVVPAPVYPSSSAKDTHYVLDHSDALGVLVEDDEQLAKVREGGEIPRLQHVYRYADLDDLRAQGPRVRRRQSHGAGRGERGDRRRRPLHLHLHLGDDRAAQGLHDPEPQLLRHGRQGRPGAVVHRPEDTVLLYLPLAHNFGRCLHLLAAYVGFTTAFCPDPLRVGEVAPIGAADGAAERPARLREGAHGRARELRRGDRASSGS